MSLRGLNQVLQDPHLREKLASRFWAKVDRGPKSSCWPWLAKARHKHGYGVISGSPFGTFNAHCVAWGLTNGLLPEGTYILHTCDNAPCCNPDHLYAGTNAQNMADMKERGRRIGIYNHSPETRRKIAEGRAKNPPKHTKKANRARSELLKKRWGDPKWRARFSALTSGPANHRFGKRPPDHQIEAVKRGHRKGFKLSEETKQKIREGQLAHQRRLRDERKKQI